MFNWIFSVFLSKLFDSQKVRVAVGGFLLAVLTKACAWASAHWGLVITPDPATVNHFVDWIFGITAGIIAGHTVTDIASLVTAPPPPDPPLEDPDAAPGTLPIK